MGQIYYNYFCPLELNDFKRKILICNTSNCVQIILQVYQRKKNTFYIYYIGPEYDDSSTLTIKHGVPFASAQIKIKGEDVVDFDGYVFPVPSDSPALTAPEGLYDAVEESMVEGELKGMLGIISDKKPLVKREGGYVYANTKQSVVKSKKSEEKGDNKLYVHALKKVGSKELMDKIFVLPESHKMYDESRIRTG